jgi:hypothetical protein
VFACIVILDYQRRDVVAKTTSVLAWSLDLCRNLAKRKDMPARISAGVVVEMPVRKPKLSSRAFWLRQMRQWHWISAAICLVGMLLFAITGITLNHAAKIEARPHVETRSATMPAELFDQLKAMMQKGKGELPAAVTNWITQKVAVDTAAREAEWSPQEIYVALPRPGGDAWLTIDRANGEIEYEFTDRGWISYLNDLHKGRNTGAAWSWFLDLFAVACVVFCLTGLVLLQLMANGRPSTWPIVGAGLLIPLLLAIFFIH